MAAPLSWAAARWFRFFRERNGRQMPLTKKILVKNGIFPLLDHYYEPLFNTSRHLSRPLHEERTLPGIDLNVNEQLDLLRRFHYNDELLALPLDKTSQRGYYYHNDVFESGDAEYLYNMIRHVKPRKIIEAGSGFSTLLVIHAIEQNKKEDASYSCEHTCIEPFENDWLRDTGVRLVKEKAETLGAGFFSALGENDILFIDSSHMIRPQGDVLFLYQEVLPQLNKGVWVHIHDIFTPRDYPARWLIDENRFWNEQYLLESFLCMNKSFRVTGALNYLVHHHRDALSACCPVLAEEQDREPGSFWMMKN